MREYKYLHKTITKILTHKHMYEIRDVYVQSQGIPVRAPFKNAEQSTKKRKAENNKDYAL